MTITIMDYETDVIKRIIHDCKIIPREGELVVISQNNNSTTCTMVKKIQHNFSFTHVIVYV